MKNKYTIIWALMWLVTVVITLSVFFITHGGDQYDTMFMLCVITVLWAETLPFIYLLWVTRRRRMVDRFLPLTMASGMVLSSYVVVVLLLSVLGLSGALSVTVFTVCHLLLLLLLCLSAGVFAASGIFLAKDEEEIKSKRIFHTEVTNALTSLYSSVSGLGDDLLENSFINFKDDIFKFSNPDSTPASSVVEAQIREKLNDLVEIVNVYDGSQKAEFDNLINVLSALTRERDGYLNAQRP